MNDGPARTPWGIEVTEMFRSESEARTINHPDYLTRLFTGGQHMHRDDKRNLQVKTVTVLHDDGSETPVQAVMTPGEPIEVRYEQLAEIIRRKSTRPYQAGLRHVSLIIRDRYDLMGDKREPYSVTKLMNAGVRKALLASPFHEVYWITVMEQEENSEQVYRPLRLLMLMEQFYLFGHGSDTWHPDDEEATPQDAVLLFEDYCRRADIDVRLWWTRDKLWVLHKGVAISLGEGTEIFDNCDYEVPEAEIRERAARDPELTDEQFEKAQAYITSNGFVCQYFEKAATPAGLRYPIMTAARLKLSERQGEDTTDQPVEWGQE